MSISLILSRLRGRNITGKHCAHFLSIYLLRSSSCSGSRVCITKSSIIKSLIAFTPPLLPFLSFSLFFSLSCSNTGESGGESRAHRKSLKASSDDVATFNRCRGYRRSLAPREGARNTDQ